MVLKKAIEVKVLVNGSAAQEYSDDDEEGQGPKAITSYIQAQSGAEFAVRFELKPSFWFPSETLGLYISIDGKLLNGTIITKERFIEHPRGYTATFEGITRSHGVTWSLEKFKFAEVKTSDEQIEITDTSLKNTVAAIGSITLVLHRRHKGTYHPPENKGSSRDWDELAELGTLPEKVLKGQALSHCTSLGLPQFASPRGSYSGCKYVDGKDNPFLVFNFKYRSRSADPLDSYLQCNANKAKTPEALEDLHMIHRTPTPVPLEERPIEELSIDEARELLRRQKERQDSATALTKTEIKPERDIKREYEDDEEYSALLDSARANKVPRIFEEGEVIDLLED